LLGSTPTPDTRQSTRSSTAQDGTALVNPISSASPGVGSEEKHGKPASPGSLTCSTAFPAADTVTTRPESSEQGTMSSCSVVENTMGSAMSVRSVLTSVSARTATVCGCGADNQNVTSPCAAPGGRSSSPSSSKNLM
jgi:hypothetical protein